MLTGFTGAPLLTWRDKSSCSRWPRRTATSRVSRSPMVAHLNASCDRASVPRTTDPSRLSLAPGRPDEVDDLVERRRGRRPEPADRDGGAGVGPDRRAPGESPAASAARNAPACASPAPLVSTASTANPGTGSTSPSTASRHPPAPRRTSTPPGRAASSSIADARIGRAGEQYRLALVAAQPVGARKRRRPHGRADVGDERARDRAAPRTRGSQRAQATVRAPPPLVASSSP